MKVKRQVNAALIVVHRLERGMTQVEFATAAGLSLRTVQRIEHGGTGELRSVVKVATLLGVPIGVLLITHPSPPQEARETMKVNFRIECPNCKWGFPWSDRYVNQGWLQLHCSHCDKDFYSKIAIPIVQVEIQLESPFPPVTPGDKV